MQESMYRYFKPGTVFFKSFPGVEPGAGEVILARANQIAQDPFFSVIEVGMIKDVLIRTQVAQIFDVAGMEVVYGTQPYFFAHGGHVNDNAMSLCSLNEGARKAAVRTFKKCLMEAHDLHATALRFASGYMPDSPTGQKKQDCKKALIDSIHQIMELAKDWGDPLITLKIFDFDVMAEQLIGPCEDALEIAEALCPRYEKFGLLTDLSHFPLVREDPAVTLPKLAPYLKAFHMGNTIVKGDKKHPIYGDHQPRFGIPNGSHTYADVANYLRILKDLKLIGPDVCPVISMEVRPLLPGETPELVLANSKRTLMKGWAMV